MDINKEIILKRYTIDELVDKYISVSIENDKLQKELAILTLKLKSTDKTNESTNNNRPDFELVKDSNGVEWYQRTHYTVQRPESRNIDIWDIIVTKDTLNDSDAESLFMVSSFAYESDFAATAFFGKPGIKNSRYNYWYGGFSPCSNYIRKANNTEIKELFEHLKQDNYSWKTAIANKDLYNKYKDFFDELLTA